MSEELPKHRSPAAPRISLEEALKSAEALYKQAGKSPVSAETAAAALGYSGITGSSLALLGSLNQYGLIERSKGTVQITPLTVRILKPVGDQDRLKALREAALLPRVFYEINENHSTLNEDVLSHHLEQQGFGEGFAKRVASSFKQNIIFAKLESTVEGDTEKAPQPLAAKPRTAGSGFEDGFPGMLRPQPPASKSNVLASYKIPVGETIAELTFTGTKLDEADFDALAEYVGLFKKQYARIRRAEDEAARTKTLAEELGPQDFVQR